MIDILQVAEKRKKLLDDLAIKYQKDCDKNREDLLRMEYKYEEDLKVLRKKLEEEKVLANLSISYIPLTR